MSNLLPSPVLVPGFSWWGAHAGIKDDTLDFGVAVAEVPCVAAGVFTRNNFPAAPVQVGREHLAAGRLQAIVVNSKNANAATGVVGLADARRMCRLTGVTLGIAPELVLPSSTGVIGVPLPMGRIEAICAQIPGGLAPTTQALASFARAIMTTDTHPKLVSASVGAATITGVAKGAGMIEPNMATMLAYLFTDAELTAEAAQGMLRSQVERSFNRISIDSDTSTNDTVVLLANGRAGPVEATLFEAALGEVCLHLAQSIVRDGEGATKLVELTVAEAPSPEAALAIARSVINSPLVKTALHGADPNWGRFVMAVGKVFPHQVPLEGLSIHFGKPEETLAISQRDQSEAMLERIRGYLAQDTIIIKVCLGAGTAQETVWGCDLTEGYIRENAYYTT